MKRGLPRRRWLAMVTLVAGVGALSWPALSFRPSSKWLFDQMVQRQLARAIRTLKIEQEIVLFGRPDAPKGLVVSGTIETMAPDGYRREVVLPNGVLREVRGAKKTVVEIPGEGTQTKKTRADLWLAFLLTGEPLERGQAADRLEAAAKEQGVALDVVSYARFDGRVNILIGSKPWEEDKAQVWIDKETLLPTRVVTVKKGADGKPSRTDLRLREWGSPEGGSWFPKTIETWIDGALVEVATTRSADRNPNLDAARFKVAE